MPEIIKVAGFPMIREFVGTNTELSDLDTTNMPVGSKFFCTTDLTDNIWDGTNWVVMNPTEEEGT